LYLIKRYYTHNAAYKAISYKSQSTVGLIIKMTIDFEDISDNENAKRNMEYDLDCCGCPGSLCPHLLVPVL
jgi:hypothetical protein